MNRALSVIGLVGCSIGLTAACENDAYLGTDPLSAPGGAGGEAATGGSGPAAQGGAANSGGRGGADSGNIDCPDSSLFCSTFGEPDLLSEWSSWQRNGETSLETTTDQAFHGDTALRAHLESEATNSRLVHVFDEPVVSGSLSARAYFYIPSTAVIDDALVGIELKDDNFGGGNKASINWAADGTARLVVTTGATPEGANSAPSAFEVDTWNCAVLRVTVGDEGRVEAEINGSVLLSAEGPTLPPDGYGVFLLGAVRPDGNTGAFEIYYDDAVVAPEPLTCPTVL